MIIFKTDQDNICIHLSSKEKRKSTSSSILYLFRNKFRPNYKYYPLFYFRFVPKGSQKWKLHWLPFATSARSHPVVAKVVKPPKLLAQTGS